jgi:hypothetical protein
MRRTTILRHAKRPANIGKSSRYAESATSTPKSPIAMNSVLWLPRTPGYRPFRACLNTTAMANEPKNKKVAVKRGRPNRAAAAATRKLPMPRLVRMARFVEDMTFPGVLHSPLLAPAWGHSVWPLGTASMAPDERKCPPTLGPPTPWSHIYEPFGPTGLRRCDPEAGLGLSVHDL